MKKKILFISHDTNLSGAPIALLNLIKWISENSEIELFLLSQNNGILLKEFSKYTTKIYSIKHNRNKSDSFFSKLFNYFIKNNVYKLKNYIVKHQIKKQNFPITYANSIASNSLLEKIFTPNFLITNVHELEFTFTSYKMNNNSKILTKSNIFICVNGVVAENLTKKYFIDKTKIKIIPALNSLYFTKSKKNILKNELKKTDAFIIGASGTVEWRKGADLFIQLALIYKNKYGLDNEKFVWTGKFPNELEKYKIELDIKNAGLENNVIFTGHITNVNEYYSNFDVFTLCSREEALGLVCIENMALGNPVICFEKCGGMEEVADKGAAIKVPYLNLEKMADEIIKLKENNDKYKNLSSKSINFVKQEYNIDKIGKKYLQIFDNV